MGRCKTCKYWRFDKRDWEYDETGLGQCARIRQRENICEPARLIEDWDDREKEEQRLIIEAKAIAVDGSGYYAAVRCVSDFGCVLHELKDPTP